MRRPGCARARGRRVGRTPGAGTASDPVVSCTGQAGGTAVTAGACPTGHAPARTLPARQGPVGGGANAAVHNVRRRGTAPLATAPAPWEIPPERLRDTAMSRSSTSTAGAGIRSDARRSPPATQGEIRAPPRPGPGRRLSAAGPIGFGTPGHAAGRSRYWSIPPRACDLIVTFGCWERGRGVLWTLRIPCGAGQRRCQARGLGPCGFLTRDLTQLAPRLTRPVKIDLQGLGKAVVAVWVGEHTARVATTRGALR